MASMVDPALAVPESARSWLHQRTRAAINNDALPFGPDTAWSAKQAAPTGRATRKSRRAPRLSTSSAETLDAAPRRTKRTRKAKQPDPVDLEAEDEAEDEGAEFSDLEEDEDGQLGGGGNKRGKLLERNRVAASKCRQKKKVWVHDLEGAKSELETQHSSLQVEYNVLLDEVNQMKNYLMVHANCNDSNIDRWIGTEAQKFVERVTRRQQEEAFQGRRVSYSGSSLQESE